ncbi:putative membrane protein [Wickerhamomyces ciferrii]|uniref:Endoplasmic reticulum junction formation protein lunapark n=1 Tax=Wickerhamomyces ciferrii (strain ATCC 14091 / BCRC 22168 / CBS 111 / JCM 3599 / NBRC 0793 / NRRL Y-1031 F-60-10) TaxID=1206466 RepID=K0KQH9_WICCF|nr:uncharacterized protein BN7_3970 [Wickerhamomyces ciferrii]CCH44407.1 putative membrane protein [Wickerhamomyces ciferrii]
MGWLSFLKSKDFDPSTFEKELSALSSKINKNERSIGVFKYHQRQSKSFVLIYGVFGYFFTLVYLLIKNGLEFHRYDHLEIGLIVATPILITLIIKIITLYFNTRINRIENHIEHLKQTHESKIEELKTKTNFQSTHALLTRFADGGDLNAQIDEELLAKQKQLEEFNKLSLEGNNESQRFNAYQGEGNERHWYDTIIDTVVGADELSPNNRYALICPNCSSHNGLAPPGQLPEFVRYICPRCGLLNGKEQPLETPLEKSDIESKGQNQDPKEKKDPVSVPIETIETKQASTTGSSRRKE